MDGENRMRFDALTDEVSDLRAKLAAEIIAHRGTKAELTEAYARRDVVRATHAETRKLADEAIENVMRCVCATAYTNHEHFTKWCNENHSSGDIRKAMGWV